MTPGCAAPPCAEGAGYALAVVCAVAAAVVAAVSGSSPPMNSAVMIMPPAKAPMATHAQRGARAAFAINVFAAPVNAQTQAPVLSCNNLENIANINVHDNFQDNSKNVDKSKTKNVDSFNATQVLPLPV